MAANINDAEAGLIDQLLGDWEAAKERGEELTVDELCKDHPTLKEVLQRHIRALSAFDQIRVPGVSAAEVSAAEVTTARPANTLVRGPQQSAAGSPLAPPQLDFLGPPQRPDELGRLQRYRILRVLGQGGMGLVLEAEDERLERRIALKVMRRDVAENVSHRERFLREARGAARVESDYIVPIYEVGEDNGLPYLTMPLLKGRPLDEILRQPNRLPLAQTIQFGREIAAGLTAAHEAGLVHRDIKPANVWIETRPGQSARARILDFGLVRTESDTGTITQTGTILGTPAYMAPEQARGDALDFRADLFSFGVMLYEMTVGHRPFKGSNTMALLSSLALDEPPAVAELDPTVPERFSQLIQALMQKDAAQRPQRTTEVLATLVVLERQATAREQSPAGTAISNQPVAEKTKIRSATEVKPANHSPSDRRSESAVAEPQTRVVPGPVPRTKRPWAVIVGATLGCLALAALVVSQWPPKPTGVGPQQQPLQPSPREVQPQIAEVSNSAQAYVLEFDPNTSIELPTFDLDPAQPLTIEGWGTFQSPPPNAQDPLIVALDFVRLRISTDHKWVVSFNTPTSESKTRIFKSDQPLSFNRRTHFAVVWSGERLAIYVDGQRQQTQPMIAAGHSPEPYYTLGKSPAAPSSFVGQLQAIHISRNARYTEATFSPAEQLSADENTLALYRFEPSLLENGRDELRDSSGHNQHGKIVDASWKPAAEQPAPAIVPFSADVARAQQAAWAQHLGIKVKSTNSLGGTMILIPPGEFLMGLTEKDLAAIQPTADRKGWLSSGMPAHQVALSRPFLLAATELTRGQFAKFVAATRYQTDVEKSGNGSGWKDQVRVVDPAFNWRNVGEPQTDQHAVSNLSWNDAAEFCNWLSDEEHLTRYYTKSPEGKWTFAANANGYRLPTEAEWEFACRAGTSTITWWGGPEQNKLKSNYLQSGYYGNGYMRVFAVAEKKPNPFGLYDMLGNVNEWCLDNSGDYTAVPERDPLRTGPKTDRILRGYAGTDWYMMIASVRVAKNPNNAVLGLGFRVSRTISLPSTAAAE